MVNGAIIVGGEAAVAEKRRASLITGWYIRVILDGCTYYAASHPLLGFGGQNDLRMTHIGWLHVSMVASQRCILDDRMCHAASHPLLRLRGQGDFAVQCNQYVALAGTCDNKCHDQQVKLGRGCASLVDGYVRSSFGQVVTPNQPKDIQHHHLPLFRGATIPWFHYFVVCAVYLLLQATLTHLGPCLETVRAALDSSLIKYPHIYSIYSIGGKQCVQMSQDAWPKCKQRVFGGAGLKGKCPEGIRGWLVSFWLLNMCRLVVGCRLGDSLDRCNQSFGRQSK